MRPSVFVLIVLLIFAPFMRAEDCFKIHGRAVWWRGDAYFSIWHVGTNHSYFLMKDDIASINLICKYFDCDNGAVQPALFADFTVCPTEPFRKGAAQPVIVKKVEHPYVVPDWPPTEKTK